MLFHRELIYLLKITDKNKIMDEILKFNKDYHNAVEKYMLEQEKKYISHSLENWDYNNAHYRTLKFYDAKNECVYQFNGNRNGIFYHNYKPFEGNYPDWALEAFQTLER